MTPPQHGDLRVCHVPLIADHAISIDVPDMHTAQAVYNALCATITMLVEHHIMADGGETFVQRFDEDGWDEVDPFDDHGLVSLTAQEELDQLRAILDKPFPKNDFYINGMPTTYHAIAEFYNDGLAKDLAKILRPDLVSEL